MRRALIASGVLLCFVSSVAFADEGMWLFNNFPKEKVKAKYAFDISQEWLDHLQRAP